MINEYDMLSTYIAFFICIIYTITFLIYKLNLYILGGIIVLYLLKKYLY